jgi:hypothetical protein
VGEPETQTRSLRDRAPDDPKEVWVAIA